MAKSIQATMRAIKDRVHAASASVVEDRLKEVSDYAVEVSPVDTGAYVESFSIGRAGFGGGRRKTSSARSVKANPDAAKEVARSNLYSDISGMNIEQMFETGDTRFTLRNRAPHSGSVEDGEGWNKDGYHVFAKIKRKFT